MISLNQAMRLLLFSLVLISGYRLFEFYTHPNYNDHFIDSSEFAWESRSNRKLSSPEIKNVIESKRILLFVKKEDGEGTDFYYLGNVSIAADSIEQGETDKGQPIVHFRFLLDNPVEDTLYDYLIQE